MYTILPDIGGYATVSELIIDFSFAPQDPIERLVWLSGAQEAFDTQVNAMWQAAYFEVRQTGRLQTAFDLAYHSHKRILAMTRAENERRGRQWKWNDGLSR